MNIRAHFRTVDELAHAYQEEQAPHKKPRTAGEDSRRWQGRILPTFGSRRVRSVERREVESWHRALATLPYEANRCLTLFSHAFNRAEAWQWVRVGSNPCRGVRRFKERARLRHFSQPELERIFRALSVLQWRGAVTPQSARAIRFLLAAGCRRNEALALRWCDVDLEGGCALVDGKTGPHEVALSAVAVALLREAQAEQGTGCEWVFPGHKTGDHLHGVQRAWERTMEAAGVSNGRVHDLRKTHGALLRAAGFALDAIADVYGHASLETTREHYAPMLHPERQRAAETVGAAITAATRPRWARKEVSS